MTNARAGQPAQPSDLVDIPHLVRLYYTEKPDPENVDQQVAFGTSGHRGSSLRTAFNEDHILATTQAIVDYRRDAGLRRAAVHRAGHRTACPSRRGRRRWRSSPPTRSRCSSTTPTATPRRRRCRTRSCGPTPARSAASTTCRRDRPGRRDRRHAVAQPADRRRVQVQPAARRARPTRDATSVIAAGANAYIRAGLAGVKRVPFDRARQAAQGYDFLGSYVDDLPNVVDIAGDPRGRRADRRRPARRRVGGLLGRDRPSGTASTCTVVNPLVDPTWRFMTLDWDGKIRMDCSSPVRDGLAHREQGRLPDLDRQRRGRRPARHRHARRRPDEPEPLPGGGDPLPVRRARPDWPADGFIGKTLVSSSMIDRVADALGRRLVEVPVGFKWFVPGPARRVRSVRRRGVGRRVVPALRRDGVDHRQGRDHPRAARLGDPGHDRAGHRASTTPS